MPIYLRNADLEVVRQTMPYIANPATATGSGFVPSLKFIAFDENKPIEIESITFVPLVRLS